MTRAMPGTSRRWAEVLGAIAVMLPAGPVSVLVDGGGALSATVADRLQSTLNGAGYRCCRLPGPGLGHDDDQPSIPDSTIMVAAGPHWRAARNWDVLIWVRTGPAGNGNAGNGASQDGERAADIVVDLHDMTWPVIRHVATALAADPRWYIAETRAFFAPRAATWDDKFGDDMPAYAAAVAQARLSAGGTVLDLGCGTGRALPALRQAVGPRGAVIAIDLTPEMLRQARHHGQRAGAALLLADARQLPLAAASVDAVFAAGLINHLPDPVAGLRQLARITRTGGRLVLFHPSGRAALAARHGRSLSPDEPLAPGPLRHAAQATGWHLTTYDDAATRFLAIAIRR